MEAATPPASAVTLPMQPVPTKAVVARYQDAAGPHAAIFRRFVTGQSVNCRLCPLGECTASDDECLVVVHALVPKGAGKLYSTAESRLDLPVDGGMRGVKVADPVVLPDEGQEHLRLSLVQ